MKVSLETENQLIFVWDRGVCFQKILMPEGQDEWGEGDVWALLELTEA